MTSSNEASGPYKFHQHDLQSNRLIVGAEHTLSDFYQWRDDNPDLVAEHVDQHTEQLQAAVADYNLAARLGRRVLPSRREAFEQEKMTREIGFFSVHNLAEMPEPDVIERFRHLIVESKLTVESRLPEKVSGGAKEALAVVERSIPALSSLPERKWLGERLTKLYRLLPESVIREGGMGKVVRAMLGVMAIGVFDTLDEPAGVRKEHLARILPAAYAYGASYPIVDDTLQDSSYLSDKDLRRYHALMLEGLGTGRSIDSSEIPDHPLAEELLCLCDTMLETFPFQEYRHLYQAAESMYLAQHRDAHKTIQEVRPYGLASMYPDIFIKAAMTRVIPNIIGRRQVDESYYARGININFINQFRDDLADSAADRKAGRLSLFTYPIGPDDTNPLHDLFAYSAYVSYIVYGDDPRVRDILTRFNATRLSEHLSSNPGYAERLLRTYRVTSEMARFMLMASDISPRIIQNVRRRDIQLERRVGEGLRDRAPTFVDPRTFVSDKLGYINEVVGVDYTTDGKTGDLNEVIAYAMEAGGKRLRPALTLMLAASLGVEARTVEPLLRAVELFHTASLVFDDLPAQDDAHFRRGMPAAHVVFGEDRAQLAGVSMISLGFSELGKLAQHYSADRVAEVVQYCGGVLGPDRLCRGQAMDLHMARSEAQTLGKDIIEMYALKTSTMIEAALVPLMMLRGSRVEEVDAMKEYAYHAGIVFQIRDDILDTTATTQALGKDVNHDVGKVNAVRIFGQDEANRLMQVHLDAAVQACQKLPFNTDLLESVVMHFATRNR